MLAAVALAVALGLPPLPPRAQDPVPPAAAAPTVPCPTCKGEGEAQQICLPCLGAGERWCTLCVRPTYLRRVPRDERLTEKDRLGIPRLLELEAKLAEDLQTLNPRGRGQVPCPAKCIVLGKGECKYCEDEPPRCPACKGEELQRCPDCRGRGRAERACEDCGGSGRLPDPVAIAPEQRASCGWCGGSAVRECVDCPPAGVRLAACYRCGGEGRSICEECLGSRKAPCRKCWATGNLSRWLGPKTSNHCDACRRKGVLPCGSCERGRVRCETCAGTGRQGCATCAGNHQRPCPGCFRGEYRFWVVSAGILEAAGELEPARDYLERAAARVELRTRTRLLWCFGPEEEREAIEREGQDEAERLAERLAQLERSSPAGG